MDTRSAFPDSPLFNCKLCAYCGNPAETNDHTPPRCFLRRPLPSDLITVPACKGCNSGFSFDENFVKTMIALTSSHPDLVAECAPGGRIDRALTRDTRLRSLIAECRRDDGNYQLSESASKRFDRVLFKTVQGLFFGLYGQFLSKDKLEIRYFSDQRFKTPEQVLDEVRPSPLRDISNEPLPELTPNGWATTGQIFFLTLAPLNGGEPIQEAFRLVRETPVEPNTIQEGVFSYAFVGSDDEKLVCVLDIWKTLVVAVAATWPSGRGPLRRGKKNPRSRDRRN